MKTNKKDNKHLDKALKIYDITEYEEIIELWKAYGGD